ncbi:MAG: glycosyltransferase family 2 protein [Methylococcaceae bacterium]
MEIAIICVCYNSYAHLREYAKSLFESSRISKGVNFQFVIVDNSSINPDEKVLSDIRKDFPNLIYVKSSNIGYFPGFKKGFDALSVIENYDYIAISNVDIKVDIKFFECLKNIHLSQKSDVGIIAPAILSKFRKCDLNPKTLSKPTRFWLQKNIFIFKHKLLFKLYRKLSDLKMAKRTIESSAGMNFYSPHGSFMLFTKCYFSKGGRIDYPRFLFGEEIFIAEECIRIGVKITYQPSLIILDDDHGSTSLEKLEFIANENLKSLTYIIKTYY